MKKKLTDTQIKEKNEERIKSIITLLIENKCSICKLSKVVDKQQEILSNYKTI